MKRQGPPILTVSSSCGNVTALISTLAGYGWTTQCVSNCTDALVYLDSNAPCLVLCESKLPDGSWRTILDALQIMPSAPLLVVFSSHSDHSLLTDALKLDGYETVIRSLAFNELRKAVTAAALGGGRQSIN